MAIVERAGLVFCKYLSKRKKMRSRPVVIYRKDLRQRSTSGFSGSMDSIIEKADSCNTKKCATLFVRPSAVVDFWILKFNGFYN